MLGVYIVHRPNVNLSWQFVIDSCLQFLSVLQQLTQLRILILVIVIEPLSSS